MKGAFDCLNKMSKDFHAVQISKRELSFMSSLMSSHKDLIETVKAQHLRCSENQLIVLVSFEFVKRSLLQVKVILLVNSLIVLHAF